MTNRETAADLVNKIRDKFNILEDHEGNEGGEMLLFEREVSVRQQDIFYRRVGDQAWVDCYTLNTTFHLLLMYFFQEIPLELAFIWSLNHERKSLVLTDHDPNLGRYAKMDPDQLRRKLEALR